MSEKFPDRNARIRELHAAGMGPTAIAREVGVSPSVVAGVIFRAQHPWHRPGRKHLRPEDVVALNLRFGGRA